jgi:hypothetical protein
MGRKAPPEREAGESSARIRRQTLAASAGTPRIARGQEAVKERRQSLILAVAEVDSHNDAGVAERAGAHLVGKMLAP